MYVCAPPAGGIQYMQKKNPLYSELKEDFNTYVNDRFSVAKGLPRDWVLGPFTVSPAVVVAFRDQLTF